MSVAELFRERPCRPTADRRLALRVRDGSAPPARLTAIVAPVRTRSGPTRLERLKPLAAWQATLEAPRIAGLRDPVMLRTQFEAASRLAQRVPVFRGEIAAGPPFESSVGAELLEGLGLR